MFLFLERGCIAFFRFSGQSNAPKRLTATVISAAFWKHTQPLGFIPSIELLGPSHLSYHHFSLLSKLFRVKGMHFVFYILFLSISGQLSEKQKSMFGFSSYSWRAGRTVTAHPSCYRIVVAVNYYVSGMLLKYSFFSFSLSNILSFLNSEEFIRITCS